MITLYRILTFLLAPFALFLGVFGFLLFLIALGNPPMLLGVFMLAGFVIYYVCSVRFLNQGIRNQLPLTQKLRDWLRVNAFVALPFAVLNFMQTSAVLAKPSLLTELNAQIAEMQQKMNLPARPMGDYQQMFMTIFYIVLVFAVILLLHILLTFSLLKKYQHLFVPKAED